jgi:asparagine synthase (glutamine-hydrolysing)
MCGICGIFAFGDQFACDEQVVDDMRDTLEHRGPDDAGSWADGPGRVALGHRRLSIVDLSPAGHQPMSNEDGTVQIVYNGEVYNHRALRERLERAGHVFRSNTDTEAIVHLYEDVGPRCVEQLEGMFALAIWDGRRNELFLARDRIGVKPLFYAHFPGGLVFGSEVKALLRHPAIGRELNREAFFHYLTFSFSPGDSTLFEGIQKLEPAERMTIGADGRVKRDRYWSPFSPSVARQVAAMSEREMADHLRELLSESIRKRMMSDVPFGVFLSGGLDSSTNVALMAEHTSEPVRTYSTAPKGHARHDELNYARLVADHFRTDHHEILIDEDDFEAFLPELVHHQDEPAADWTAVPQHFVSKLARDDGTIVVQVGEGADEIFHGYKGYATHRRVVQPFQLLPQRARRAVAKGVAAGTRRSGRGVRHGEALLDAARSSVPYWGGALCFRGDLKEEVLGDGLSYPDTLTLSERLWREAERESPSSDVFQKMSYVELKQRLPELLLARLDRIAMANSVEGREPFLDHDVVEFAFALPGRMKYRKGEGKYVLREAVRDILPEQVLNRPKQGFGTPMDSWLRGPFGERARESVRNSGLVKDGLIDGERADRLFRAHLAGGDWSYHLWNLYNAGAWYDHWIAGRSPALAT